MAENIFSLPTQHLDLPSKGWFYPENHPLSSGKVELKIPTAKEEDILTNMSYIQQNIVMDKLLKSVIVTPINMDDILTLDKDAILFCIRILMYGKNYQFKYNKDPKPITYDLSKIEEREIDFSQFTKGKNEFPYVLPMTNIPITYKLLTHKDERDIELEVEGLKKLDPNLSTDITTRLKYVITSVNDKRDTKSIRDFVDAMPAMDSRSFRKHLNNVVPGLNKKISFTTSSGEVVEDFELPVTVDFFWPTD